MLKYKLTSQKLTTYNGFQWEVGVPVTTNGNGELCGPGWLHYYHHPLLAVFLNPIHGNYDNPRLWEVEAEGDHLDDHGLKGGCTRMTLVREIEPPSPSVNQRIAFSILCALEVCDGRPFLAWANDWLNGTDRTATAAGSTWALAARAAVLAAAERAKARAAAWATAERAALAAATADWTAAAMAAAELAAERAARKGNEIDLIALAEQAMQYE